MITFILPGYSPHNKTWADEVASKLNLNHEIRPVYWEHWEGGKFDIQETLDKLIALIGNQEINIVAKSIGVVVGILLLSRLSNQVKKIILCGTNLKPFAENYKGDLQNALSLIKPENILFIQNDQDQFGSFEKIDKLVRSLNSKVKVLKKARSGHDYPYFADFQEFLASSSSSS